MASAAFSDYEKAALKVDSADAFVEYWQDTISAKTQFDHSHEKGCGLWVKRYQSSADLVLPFIQDFSPIVQIVKDLGAPYGGAAVGVVSLLFTVSVEISLYLSL